VFSESLFNKGLVAVLSALFWSGTAGGEEELPLRDPMQPYQATGAPNVEGAAPRRLELSAVLISSTRRVAVLNGRPYRQGDRVNGAELTRIEPTSVHLRGDDGEIVIRLAAGHAEEQIIQGDSGS